MKETGTVFMYDREFHEGSGARCDEIEDLADGDLTAYDKKIKEQLQPGLDPALMQPSAMRTRHPLYCGAEGSHEQCSSFVAVNYNHPGAVKAMAMLKRLHTR